MKNIKISIFCALIITTATHCPQEDRFKPRSRPNPWLTRERSSGFQVRQNQPVGQKKPSIPKMSTLEKIDAVCTVVQLGKEICSWLPSKVDQQVVARNQKELEEYSILLAQQREIDTAKRTFYKCCKDNNGLNVDRLTTGLPRACQDAAMAFAAYGFREDVEEAVIFFNKFRE